MTVVDAVKYAQNAVRISKREQREAIQVSGYVWMKEQMQNEIWKSLQDEAEVGTPTKILTPDLREEGLRIQAELDAQHHVV